MNQILKLPLTYSTVEMAVHFIAPILERGAQSEVFKRNSVYLYVMDPKKRFGDYIFQEAVLWEGAIGDRLIAEQYQPTAMRKAIRGWRTGMSGTEIQYKAPHLFEEGDTKWHGDFVENGLVVAGSGIQGHFDELISTLIGRTIISLCRDEVIVEIMPAEEDVFV